MLEFWRSLSKQSNPSTLTAADLIPNFTRPQPPPFTRDGDGINGDSEGETRFSLLSPNRASRANVSSYREKNKTRETEFRY